MLPLDSLRTLSEKAHFLRRYTYYYASNLHRTLSGSNAALLVLGRQDTVSASSGGRRTHRPASPGDSGGPNDWKALAPTTLDSVPVGVLRWGAAGGVLGVLDKDMADGAHILAETVLHRQLRCDFAFLNCGML